MTDGERAKWLIADSVIGAKKQDSASLLAQP
jgi:hypothetical protein